MPTQTVTKKNIELTLRNMSVELYAVEEALGHASQNPHALDLLKLHLAELIKEVEDMQLPDPIQFEAPTPPVTMRFSAGSGGNGVRRGICS